MSVHYTLYFHSLHCLLLTDPARTVPAAFIGTIAAFQPESEKIESYLERVEDVHGSEQYPWVMRGRCLAY